MQEQHRQLAEDLLAQILQALHEKRFGEIQGLVDASKIDDMESFLVEFVQGTLNMNGLQAIDEYGAPCSFKPAYAYSQLHFYEYQDGRGFMAEYEMTAGGELADLALQIEFLYTENGGLSSVFRGVDPQ